MNNPGGGDLIPNIQQVSIDEEQRGGFAPRRKTTKIKVASIPLETPSIEDALKSEINYMPMKTPVSILQELLSRRGITPSYELVQIEGAIHEPTFRYRVSFNNRDAMGAGRSKKEAKHAAAKALIDKLTGSNTDIPIPTSANDSITSQLSSDQSPLNDSGGDEKVVGNPIGWLQEMCMAKHWPPPTYETELEVGLPHERQFTIACAVLKYKEIGQGKSKKVAKRIAAHKMWKFLQANPLDTSKMTSLLDDEGNEDTSMVRNVLNRYADLKEAHIPTMSNHYSHNVSQFHKTLKSKFGTAIAQLKATCLYNPDINLVQMLQDLAVQMDFEVTYVDIEEKTLDDKHQCLVQLSSMPVAVCHGTGENIRDAQVNAALNALEYLKVMTKK